MGAAWLRSKFPINCLARIHCHRKWFVFCICLLPLLKNRPSQSFYKEAVLLKYLSHENIIPWLGVSKEHFPLSIVTEWIPNGNIRNYVQNHPEADRLALVSVASAHEVAVS